MSTKKSLKHNFFAVSLNAWKVKKLIRKGRPLIEAGGLFYFLQRNHIFLGKIISFYLSSK
jgi:hypothetical protein